MKMGSGCMKVVFEILVGGEKLDLGNDGIVCLKI